MASKDLFIKIPKSLHSITPKNARLYAAFLDFKLFNQHGCISGSFRKADRFYYRYWINQLCASGWATKIGSSFYLKSYQEVWEKLGVVRSYHQKIKKYRYDYQKINVDDFDLERKAYSKQLINLVLSRVSSNKERQIKWKLKKMQGPGRATPTETFLSCRSVALLFGLKSSASGSKYRKLCFKVYDDPLELRKTPTGFKYKCKRIAL